MCHSDTLTCLIKHLFQYEYLTKSWQRLLKSFITSLFRWKLSVEFIYIKIQSLKDYTLSQNYFKPFKTYISNDLSIMYLI